MRFLLLLALVVPSISLAADPPERTRPNVLWLYLEDVSRWFACDGDPIAAKYDLTPNIDALVAKGQRLDRFYTTAGVCSATRSAVMTGMHQGAIGAHHHRSSRPVFRGQQIGENGVFDANVLPDHIRCIPELFRDAGYYTWNEGGGKDDFNFIWDPASFYDHRNMKWNFKGAKNGSDWSGCPDGTPWFGQIQIAGGKEKMNHRKFAQMNRRPLDRSVVPVPPYYPDVPIVREQIANHYDTIAYADWQVGQILAALERDGLRENTYLMMLSDHGYGMHRDKQFLYEGGIHMPAALVGPGIEPGTRTDLISSIDFGPTSLALAGLPVPDHMQGQDVLAEDYEPKEYVVAARDRCDYTIERIRAVVSKDFKYLRNGLTDRPYMQPNYKDEWEVTKVLRKMAADGSMTDVQMAFYDISGTAPFKPAEELYDLAADPHEINNLADDPALADVLAKHRAWLDEWIEETGDAGQQVESDAGLKATLQRWGDKCVNPEYDRVR